jgi:hypothetical protein
MEGEKASVSVDVDKRLLLKFKSMCVLREVTMSEEIEKMIGEWIRKKGGVQPLPKTPSVSPSEPAEAEESSEADHKEKDIKA